MSTDLEACMVLLSKSLGDYWAGTTTTGTDSASVIDTALKAKANDWITKNAYDRLTSGTYENEERKITSLSNTTGDLTVLAHGGTVASGVTYEVHRLFTASEKRIAIVHAAKSSFPHIHVRIKDESMVSGNWLKDGSFEIWTAADDLTYWNESTVTVTKTTTSPYYKHGKTSCKLSGSAGYIEQSLDQWDDLKHLAGKSVTFTVQGYSTAASSLRLSIYDGTTMTYSSYHDGDSAFTKHSTPLSVVATIQDNPTDIAFRIYYASGTAYVDDARVMGPSHPRIYIGDLGLAQNKPHQVLVEPSDYSTREPWLLIHGIDYDQTNGYMSLPTFVSRDFRLRILGIGYLDFYDSSDDVGTDWEDTIAINAPQTQILVAEAAIYLCNQMIMPNFSSGETTRWERALAYWKQELFERIGRYGMEAPGATVHWSN